MIAKKVLEEMREHDFIVKNEGEILHIEVEKNISARDIVNALVAERKRLGLTQQDVANITGMKAPNITRIESCRYTPTLEVLERYAQAVGKRLKLMLVDAD